MVCMFVMDIKSIQNIILYSFSMFFRNVLFCDLHNIVNMPLGVNRLSCSDYLSKKQNMMDESYFCF